MVLVGLCMAMHSLLNGLLSPARECISYVGPLYVEITSCSCYPAIKMCCIFYISCIRSSIMCTKSYANKPSQISFATRKCWTCVDNSEFSISGNTLYCTLWILYCMKRNEEKQWFVFFDLNHSQQQ